MGRFPSAQTLTIARQSDTPIKIHSKHPLAFDQFNPDEGYRRSDIGPPFRPNGSADSVGDYCAAVLSTMLLQHAAGVVDKRRADYGEERKLVTR